MKQHTTNWPEFDLQGPPEMTLRSGDNIDSRGPPLPFDPNEDIVSKLYLNKNVCGLPYVNFLSWVYYIFFLMSNALDCYAFGSDAASDGFIQTLEIKGRNLDYLNQLNLEQKKVILDFLKSFHNLSPSYYMTDIIDNWLEFVEFPEHDQ